MKRILLPVTAALLVWSSAAAAEPVYLMTKEEMIAIHQQSCQKMNTVFSPEVLTLDELSAWEEASAAGSGLSRREDHFISSLPMQGDLCYEDALTLAKGMLVQKFGVSEEALDAMGVYPRLLDYVYTEQESEWEFLFSPLRSANIMQYHDLTDEGEYHAVIAAQTGTARVLAWYSPRLSDSVLIGEAEAAALKASGLDAETFAAHFAPGYVHHYNQQSGTCLILICSRTADLQDGDHQVYQATADYETGEILRLDCTDGVG